MQGVVALRAAPPSVQQILLASTGVYMCNGEHGACHHLRTTARAANDSRSERRKVERLQKEIFACDEDVADIVSRPGRPIAAQPSATVVCGRIRNGVPNCSRKGMRCRALGTRYSMSGCRKRQESHKFSTSPPQLLGGSRRPLLHPSSHRNALARAACPSGVDCLTTARPNSRKLAPCHVGHEDP